MDCLIRLLSLVALSSVCIARFGGANASFESGVHACMKAIGLLRVFACAGYRQPRSGRRYTEGLCLYQNSRVCLQCC